MVVLEGKGCVGVMQLWTLPAHLPHWKRTVHGTYPRSALWRRRVGSQPEGGCLFACSQRATIAATVTVRTRQIYFYNYPQHNAGVSHDLWLYNSLFESAIWSWFWRSAVVLLPVCSGSKAQNGGGCRALEGREWKPFSNRARLRQKNNSRLATNWRVKI